MKLCIFVILASFITLGLSVRDKPFIVYDPHEFDYVPSLIKTPRPLISIDDLPTNFTWGNVDGKNYLTVIKNQHIPAYCGGCFAFSTTSSISDRIKIMRKGQGPDILISPQVVLSCSNNHGCHGGASILVHSYIHLYGVSDESCSPYRARGLENGAPCTDEIKCTLCDSEGNCEVPESYPVYYVSEYGRTNGTEDMMSEIFLRGPIECMIDSSYIEDYTGGIVNITAANYTFDHYIAVVGFGEEDGVPYWLVRNSWGSFWGLDGFFKVIRGQNSIGIETTCTWAVPTDNWINRNFTNKKSKKENFLEIISDVTSPGCVKKDPSLERPDTKTGVATWQTIDVNDIPTSWDWRNVSGQNYISTQVTENAPDFCASCWAIAPTTALSSRITIGRKAAFPVTTLAVQTLINCNAGGNCTGGDPLSAYAFAYSHGIPDGSCQNYIGADPSVSDCSGMQLCKSCEPPAVFANGTDPQNCTEVPEFTNWKISDYGVLKGVDDMKKAIYQDGPIACSITVTEGFRRYKTGVLSQDSNEIGDAVANHEVTVIGWDVDDSGVEHWIVSNSWGTAWGDQGFVRIKTGSNSLGIENECVWALPILQNIGNKTSGYSIHIYE